MTDKPVSIDPMARVAPTAKIGTGVTIGPFCVVGPEAELGDGVTLHSHVTISGATHVGARTEIFPFAAIGGPPQDLSYKGEPTRLEIGEDCLIRESVTVNRGSARTGLTVIGSNCFLMSFSHVAHDCRVGNNVIMANVATLAGHVHVGDFVFFAGLCTVHQFTRIGEYAMVGGMTGVKDDVVPFGMAFAPNGVVGELVSFNAVGMKRRGFSRADMHAVRACYKALFDGEGTYAERRERAAETYRDHPAAGRVIRFVEAGGKRPLMRPPARGVSSDSADDA